MFGYVTASWKELTAGEQKRYGAVYCGICREIRQRSTGIGRICLSYDMAFLALLLMSLYEPEEESGKKACRLQAGNFRGFAMGGTPCASLCLCYAAQLLCCRGNGFFCI